MAQVVLDRPRILAIVGELVPAAMPQHVAGNQEREFRRLPGVTILRGSVTVCRGKRVNPRRGRAIATGSAAQVCLAPDAWRGGQRRAAPGAGTRAVARLRRIDRRHRRRGQLGLARSPRRQGCRRPTSDPGISVSLGAGRASFIARPSLLPRRAARAGRSD